MSPTSPFETLLLSFYALCGKVLRGRWECKLTETKKTGSLLFYLWWRVALRREEKQERERIEDLRRRGLLQDLREKREIGSVDR